MTEDGSLVLKLYYTLYGSKYVLADRAYIAGKKDGLFHPNDQLTRAEIVVILVRLTADFDETLNYGEASFEDVKGRWSENYIAYAEMIGLVDSDMENYYPNLAVTRADFAGMMARFAALQPSDEPSGFTDMEDHPYDSYVAALKDAGVISGYKDGTFRPTKELTRAEAVKMINRVMGFIPDGSAKGEPFPDVTEKNWFYQDVCEATRERS